MSKESDPQLNNQPDRPGLVLRADVLPTPEVAGLKQQLTDYLEISYKNLPDVISISETVDRVADILTENNMDAKIAASSGFETIVNEKKKLRGPASISMSICPDGRNNIKVVAGVRAHKESENLAGLVETKDAIGGVQFASDLLTRALKKRVHKGQLLHFSLGHFSRRNPANSCGAMKLKRDRGVVDPELRDEDLPLENVKLLKYNAEVFDKVYNQAAKEANQQTLERVAITGLINTDTLGLVFGLGTPHELDVTEITKNLLDKLPRLVNSVRPYNAPGQLKDFFNDPKYLISVEQDILFVVKKLLNEKNTPALDFIPRVNNWLDSSQPKLTEEQRQAFRFVVATNVASQYLSGFYEGNHDFTEHNERFQTVSKDGINIGKHMYDSQVFASNAGNAEIAISNIVIKSSIMDKSEQAERPHLVFVSMAVPQEEVREWDKNIEFFRSIKNDPRIVELIKSGNICLIPVSVKRKTGEVLKIDDVSSL